MRRSSLTREQGHPVHRGGDAEEQERWEALLLRLRCRFAPGRVEAAVELSKWGPVAVEPLCQALQDREAGVRAAAARSLGFIGDARAVRPLAEALRRGFIGGAGQYHRAFGLALSVSSLFLGVLYAIFAFRSLSMPFMILGTLAGVFLFEYFRGMRKASGLCGILTEALVQIAERNPTPELRSVLEDLKAVRADVLQQDVETRALAHRATALIEQRTAATADLPLPWVAGEVDGERLPVPMAETRGPG